MSPLDEAIIANDALPERERKTNIDLADEFNTSEATVRRHRRALKRKGRDELDRDAFFDLPVGAITKRGKTVRLADGSYEKIEYRPGAVEMGEAKRLPTRTWSRSLGSPCCLGQPGSSTRERP